ncbi:glycoside hydrolase family 3 C-terminal domain-containing protein [Fulvivirga sedimenti]|uniref:Glycoside hydrolase family 3 C-terminal domain-containing protein n=1 Tax=Fulvivirga sedimenti TaxID=2879465 RepID=A0A9X1KWT3_9BACT|nr:glycoside hydrolase family 3 C-terminal domain-containing protein [Fulvivirga sedimenti]MCA6075065.1 glycoside hydrolase family 3 C-terminal domain-containing protein [Fulvivirga sedimenti]MCA6076242.1 glycoside hydrolase family 3 C-terminal domain-containing protein [Fulvivirga sedimenti]MCA6077370.1 glycoside hydrolase family 3 C-terminal domain-containing protein [Fulvivirga sedimenti]
MKKGLKVSLIVLGSLLGLLLIAATVGWIYVRSTFLNFENEYTENKDIQEVTIDGYTFPDRNGNGMLDIYEDSRRSTSERVNDLLSQMTLEEKIHLLKGSGLASALGNTDATEGIPGAAGTIVATPRLGIPTVYLSDGPAGLRIVPIRENDDATYYCTAFPIGTLLASTWNTSLVEKVGTAMGNEAVEYGIDVILGPGANIHRHPLCGRNFEYYSEDPILTGYIGAAMVNGIESNGVGASVKHFVANNQETRRLQNDAIVSERALREIYLKGFEIIVKESQPWTIMSSYNRVNGTYASESRELLTDILRDEWGFRGIVMSDWFGGQNAPAQIAAGNDLLEPGTRRQWDALREAAASGELSEADIDTAVKRILTLVIESRKMQSYVNGNNPDLEAHSKITRQSAAEGIVLLKNDQLLPLRQPRNIALMGVTSYDFIAGGTGSGDVNEAYTVSLREGLENAGFEINAAAVEIYNQHKAANTDAFFKPEGINAMLEPYNPPQISYTDAMFGEFAQTADIGVVTIGRNSGEGYDRVETDDFLLTQVEKDMIERASKAFHAVNKKLLVVLNIGGVIETASWKDQPDAILLAWQGGQEGGNSVADILVGNVNPSGKLPMTFPVHLNDHASNANFPLDGEPFDWKTMMFSSGERAEDEKIRNKDYTLYEEGIYVGYRHFDKAGLDVSYPFGFGLSYTTFEYSAMVTEVVNDTVDVKLTIINTGNLAGKEVVQFYVSKSNSSIDRAPRELKSFSKTPELNPGDSIEISIKIPVAELRYWNEDQGGWVLENGSYKVQAGASSRDIRVENEIEL